MFAKLRIIGMIPHDDTTIEFGSDGSAAVVAPSGWGKTTLLHAVCWLLWGTDADGGTVGPDHIRGDRMTVEAVTLKGTALRRSMTRGKTTTREMTLRDEQPRSYTTERDWRAALARLGDETRARPVLVPMGWLPLAEGAGSGRPLRDWLLSLLPPSASVADIARESLGRDLASDGTEKDAARLATAAGREVDVAAGRVQACEGAVVQARRTGPLPPPDAAQMDAARAVLERVRAAQEWLLLHREWSARRSACDDWDRRAAACEGAPPEPALARARDTMTRVETAHHRVAAAAREAREAHARAREAVARAEGDVRDVPAETCPTCGHSMSPGDIAAARSRAEQARDLVATLRGDADTTATRARVAAEEEQQSTAAVERARDALRTLERLAAQRAALGERPPEPGALPERVAPPSAEELRRAESVTRAASTHADAAAHAAAQMDAAIAAHAAALAEHTAAQERHRAAVEELAAVRAAPSELLRRQAAFFSDLGEVSLLWGESGGVQVLCHGRPWSRASRGERVRADYLFRAALRRIIGLPTLLLVLDDEQSWFGEEMPLQPATLRLRTGGKA